MSATILIYLDRKDEGQGGHTRSILYSLDHLRSEGFNPILRISKSIPVIRDLFQILLRIPKATIINSIGVAYRKPMLFYITFSLIIRHPIYIYWHETSWVYNRLNDRKRLAGRLFGFLIKKTHIRHLVTCTRAKHFCMSLGIREENIYIIGECIKPIYQEKFDTGHNNNHKEFITVISIGSIQLRKGTDIFCKAAITACQKNEKFEFEWIGPNLEFDKGLYESCILLIKSYGLENRIRFYGFIEDLSQFYTNADIFVLSSRDDPMPLSNLEAMSFGKTVITFDIGGAPEALNGTGHVLDKPDSDQLAEKLIELASLPRKELFREDAHRRVLSEFSPKQLALKIIEAIAAK